MEEVPLLKELHRKYAAQAAIVGISTDISVPRVDRVVKDKEIAWPILADGKGFDGPVAKAYHIQGTPELFILDRDGRIFARTDSTTQLEAILLNALAQK